MSWHRYARVFRTEILTGVFGSTGNVVLDPVRIEIFMGPRGYKLARSVGSLVKPAGRDLKLGQTQCMVLPAGYSYMEFVVRTKNPRDEAQFCEDLVVVDGVARDNQRRLEASSG